MKTGLTTGEFVSILLSEVTDTIVNIESNVGEFRVLRKLYGTAVTFDID